MAIDVYHTSSRGYEASRIFREIRDKEASAMTLWAYFTENKSSIYAVNNSPLFLLIRDAGGAEENIFIDDIRDSTRPELAQLFGVVASEIPLWCAP